MLNQIEIENVDSILLDLLNNRQKFNNEILKVLLENSCYYPASGTDATPIKYLENIQSFIYCDCRYGFNEWTNQIIKEMDNYELIFQEKLNITKSFDKHFFIKIQERKKEIRSEITEIQEQILIIHVQNDDKKNKSLIQENSDKINRLEKELFDLKDKFTNNNLLEEILKRTINFSHITIWKKSEKYLSIIYISSEAVHCYDQLFLKNKLTPKVISIIQPGHTMGGNWTNFFDIRSEFLQTVCRGPLPKYMLIGSYGNHWRQVSYDHCNFEEISESRRTVRDSNSNDGHYVYLVKNKGNLRLDLENKISINEFDLLLKTIILENLCLRINCTHCDNWNVRSVLIKLKPEEIIQKIKLFSFKFLNSHDELFRFLIYEIKKLNNGKNLIQTLVGTPSYIRLNDIIVFDKKEAEEYRRLTQIRLEAENERKRLLKLAATPEAIAERKLIRKQLREIKTSPQRIKKQLTKELINDFIIKINNLPDSELLNFILISENKIPMRAAGGIVYKRILGFLKSRKISDSEKATIIKFSTDHSWHWTKLYKKIKSNL